LIDHYNKVLASTEARVERLLKIQVKSSSNRDYGGLMNPADYMVSAKFSIYGLTAISSVYFNQDSRYFNDNRLYEAIGLLMDYIEGVQRDSGNFDLISCNFDSAPDTAFMVQRLAIAYKLANKFGSGEKSRIVKDKLMDIIKKAGYGIADGGFHTPNHRWVIASALMMSHNITGIQYFKEVAEKYLGEGIDCNEDGEFTERSTGIYNVVNDNALIILAEETENWNLLEYVKRNLEMMLTFIEPDGSIYTGNSTRQDKGIKYYPDNYYHLYLYMANRLKDGRFAYMANDIISRKNSNTDVQSFAESLYLFMLNPELKKFDVDQERIIDNYEKYYKDSGVVRVRRGDMCFTISENSTEFLEFNVNGLSMYMKLASSFFEIGQFNVSKYVEQWQRECKTSSIKQVDDRYEINFKSHGNYYMPFAGDKKVQWGDMEYGKRDIAIELDLYIKVIFEEIEDGIKVTVSTDGCDRVPVKIELGFTADSTIEGDSFLMQGKAGNSIVAKKGGLKVRKFDEAISIDSAFGEHLFTENMRGSEAISEHHFTVFFTDYTNFNKSFTIKKLLNAGSK